MANRAEALELSEAAGFDNVFPRNIETAAALRSLINLLDFHGEEFRGEFAGPLGPGEAGGGHGVIDELLPIVSPGDTANTLMKFTATRGTSILPDGGGSVRFRNSTGDERFPLQGAVGDTGMMLYRIAVPEPASLLACVALLALISSVSTTRFRRR